jgi:tetratricopeptide (TPR) repeat protein
LERVKGIEPPPGKPPIGRGAPKQVRAVGSKAHAKLGQLVDGLNYLTEAARLIEATDKRQDEAELYRLRGDLLFASGDETAADQNYRRALTVSRKQSANTLELRAASGLARLLRDRGKRNEARDLLAPVYNWFTEGFDTPVLQDAKKLLDQLSAA